MKTQTERQNYLALLNREIDHLERRLAHLYLDRAGRMDNDAGYGWCVMCGKHTVNPVAGEDTCPDCLETL